MHRHYPLLVLLSLLAMGLTATTLVCIRPTGLPFAWHMLDVETVRISPIDGVAFPAGLDDGDVIRLREQNPALRGAFLASYQGANVPTGAPLQVIVERDGRHVTVPVRISRLGGVPQLWLTSLLSAIFAVLAMVTVLITLWRGRDRSAWGISLWGTAFLAGLAFTLVPTGGWASLATMLASSLMYALARIGFYVMAEAIAGPALTPRLRRILRALFALLLLAGLVYELAYPPLLVFGGQLIPQSVATVWALPYLLATAMLLIGYRQADAARRQRLRWMFWSALVLTVGIQFSNVPMIGPVNSGLVNLGAFVVAISGLLYAVLRHRLVDMAFVVNRAVVYSTTLSVVVGIFILLESFVEKVALPHNTNLILELGVPLAVGFSLESVRKRVESLSERLFFRRRFKAEAALRAFVHRCPFVEKAAHLLEQTLAELRRYSDAPAVAFYWNEQDGYRRTGAIGKALYPERLDPDDPAVVGLRADRRETDLAEVHSALGADGLLLPMIVRGELLGAIVCANRPGERYPSDEREALAGAAHEVGAALHALHSRDSARYVAAMAAGELSLEAAIARARALPQSA